MSVAIGEAQASFCATLVDELARAGVERAVVCPGSRSTPLSLAFLASDIDVTVRLDERSAAFIAVGMARVSRRPVPVVVTSGTAAAELFAAVCEADLDGVPLLVITADRPPELHGIGAPQTIDQAGLFTGHVRAQHDPGPVHALPIDAWRSIASRVVADSQGTVPGPVHLNVSLSDPLVAQPAPLPPGRPGGAPWTQRIAPTTPQGPRTVRLEGQRGVIVAGAGCGQPDEVRAAAVRMGWPILADPRSGLRSDDGGVIMAPDLIVRDEAIARLLAPDSVLLAGAPHASKVLTGWLSAIDADVVSLGGWGPARHPTRRAARFLEGPPSLWWEALEAPTAEAGWRERWSAADAAVATVLDNELAVSWTEPSVARRVARFGTRLDGGVLVSSSSMPIRDLEWFGGSLEGWGPVVANRGANGIDGVTSTAIGAAIASRRPTVALIGDLAFLHDVSSLVEQLPAGTSMTAVVVDNGGGGIFSFLPQATLVDNDAFEEAFGTPRPVDLVALATAMGHHGEEVQGLDDLDAALERGTSRDGISVVRCVMDTRASNVGVHERLVDATSASLQFLR